MFRMETLTLTSGLEPKKHCLPLLGCQSALKASPVLAKTRRNPRRFCFKNLLDVFFKTLWGYFLKMDRFFLVLIWLEYTKDNHDFVYTVDVHLSWRCDCNQLCYEVGWFHMVLGRLKTQNFRPKWSDSELGQGGWVDVLGYQPVWTMTKMESGTSNPNLTGHSSEPTFTIWFMEKCWNYRKFSVRNGLSHTLQNFPLRGVWTTPSLLPLVGLPPFHRCGETKSPIHRSLGYCLFSFFPSRFHCSGRARKNGRVQVS